MADERQVLILCTGNSARSIMAEYLVNHDLAGRWKAYSAGVDPSKVNPRSVQVMEEIGIPLEGARSKSVDEFLDRDDLDLVVTVCDHARETCPVFMRPVEQVHLGFEDPAPYADEPDDIALAKFRDVRDAIRRKLVGYLSERGERSSSSAR